MRVRLRLSDPELVDDLLDFLRRRECEGEQVEDSELLEVALPQTLQKGQAEMELLGIFMYPDNETAFRALGKIAKLELFETETFPAEDVEVFFKALV